MKKNKLVRLSSELGPELRDEFGSGWTSGSVRTGASHGIFAVSVTDDIGQEVFETLFDVDTRTIDAGSGRRYYVFQHPGFPVPDGVLIAPRLRLIGENGRIVSPVAEGSDLALTFCFDDPDIDIGVAPEDMLRLIRAFELERRAA